MKSGWSFNSGCRVRASAQARLALILAFAAALATAPTAAVADQLVVRLDGLSTTRQQGAVGSTEQRVAIPSGLPRLLRLPLGATAGDFTLSLRQQDLDAAVEEGAAAPTMRVRVVATGVGSVSEDATGKVTVGMDTALAFDDLATDKSRVFDVRIRAAAEGDAAYGVELPIYIEAWRRADDGKPVENRTQENRSFWGTMPGHFER